jgi:formylglycine-generating enzyme required for sulfatase activity
MNARHTLAPHAAPRRQTLGEDVLWIPGGRFTLGSDDHYPEERPARPAVVDGLWMDRLPVTNRQFARFVAETGHVTVAEQAPDPREYPGADPNMLVAASLVFTPPADGPVDLREPYRWWTFMPGADWRHPQGPRGDLAGLENHPVVHVAWADVQAYTAWAGGDLPTEAEWEFAARGGLEGAEFAWGDQLFPAGRPMANTWQGAFPGENTLEDGWARTSPVGAYPPNGHGLYDMIGNTWEWTRDWWSIPGPEAAKPTCCSAKNPRGGEEADSHAPGDLPIPRKVLKGGSHLCAPNYCKRYRPAARHAHPIDTSASHVGFRCVYRPTS